MASKLKDLSDEEVLRIARARVTESAASTYTEVSLDTQLSVERGIIWMVNFIEVLPNNLGNLGEAGQGTTERIEAQVTRESQSSIVNGNDADLLQAFKFKLNRAPTIGTDAGPMYFTETLPWRVNFPVPIPFASSSMFFGILGTDAGSAHTVDFRVGYTIRSVTDKFFFRVAQALLG